MEYGPQTTEVDRIIGRIQSLTPEQTSLLGEVWKSCRKDAWDVLEAVWDTARSRRDSWRSARAAVEAARYRWKDTSESHGLAWEERDLAWYAINDAVLATVVQDLIEPQKFKALTHPWNSVMEGTS